MPTATKMTFDRLEASRSLLARARSQGDQVAADLTARLAPLLEEGEEMPDVAQLLRLLERMLEGQRGRIAEAGSARSLDADTLTVLLHRRDTAAGRLYTELVNVRRAVIGCFGRDVARIVLPMGGRTPRHAGRLMLLARRVVDRFGDPTLELPAAAIPGVDLRPELWARQLQPHLDELREILEQIDTARGKTVGNVLSKRDALAEFDTAYGRVARCLETVWDLADGPYKARRLRSAVRRRQRAISAGERPATEAARLSATIEAGGEPEPTRIAVSAPGELADGAFAAEPAPATGKAVLAPQGGWRAWLKEKWRETRFQEPTEERSRAKAPSQAVRNGFRGTESSTHRRSASLRGPESTGHQRLSASRRPSPPAPRRRRGCRRATSVGDS